MKSIALIDTSILLELLEVPGRDSKSAEIKKQLREKQRDAKESLILPLAAILETGNHVGRVPDGALRRQAAKRFVDVIELALKNQAPFVARVPENENVSRWCSDFQEWVKPEKRELTDLSIRETWERVCDENPGRRVYIWSLDSHLASFDRTPAL